MDKDKFKMLLEDIVKKYNVPGADCIVCRGHETLFRHYTGVRDLETKEKMDGTELYLIFSMTKILTCICALQLYEKGKFKMDDPVSKYLPVFSKMKVSVEDARADSAENIITGGSDGEETKLSAFSYAKNPITIKHLFTMGAGFDYNLKAEGIIESLSQGKNTTRELVEALHKTVLGFEPGTRFRYSLCHDVLGALIEVWSGKTLGEYMKENIFEPLGMKDTFFGVPKDVERLSRMATLYIYNEPRKPEKVPMECPYNLSESYESGGAGLCSSPEDYSKFLCMLSCRGVAENGKRIIKAETIDLMRTNHLNDQQFEDFQLLRMGYGYGLGVRTHMDSSKSNVLSPIGEFGWNGAAGSVALVDVENNISMTYFQHVRKWDKNIQKDLTNALYTCLSDNE